MKYKILNTEPEHYSPWAKKELRKIGILKEKVVSQKELLRIIPNFDILLIGWGLYIKKEVLERAKNLKVLASATTNERHIDLETAKKKKIKVFTLKGQRRLLAKVPSTSELAFGLLLALARFIPTSFQEVKKYRWDRDKFKGHELFEKTMGILGYGRLGKIMASQAKGFGMKVLAYDPYIAKKEIRKDGVVPVAFNRLVRESDVLSLHLTLTPESKHIINRSVFKKMKKTAFLINTARGEVINEKDLLWALKTGKIAGAGLDFLEGEWSFREKFPRNNLIEYAKSHNNLIITPHLGGMTQEAVFKVREFLTKKIIKWFSYVDRLSL
ncbi:MAG: NAD(P)-dependent oxidoreductase [Candidatus Paceibacterales bacterium]